MNEKDTVTESLKSARKTFTITFWNTDLSKMPGWKSNNPKDFKGIAHHAANIIRNEEEDDGKWRDTVTFTIWDGPSPVIDRVHGGTIKTYQGMIDPQIRYIVKAMVNADNEHQQPSLAKYFISKRQ